MTPTHEVKAMIELLNDDFQKNYRLCAKAASIMQSLLSEREWNYDMDAAPRDKEIDAIVDGDIRLIRYGKTSHISLNGFCLADQGPEDFDLCSPTAWKHRPQLPESE